MKKAFVLTGLALLASAGTAAAAPPAATPATPPPAASAPAAPPATPPTAAEIEASRQIVAGADVERMLRDRAYAAGLLVHIDRLGPLAEGNPEARLAIENLRLFALITQERPGDVRAGVDALLAERPTDGAQYAGAWYGALSIEDLDRALAVVETSSRNVPGVHGNYIRN